MEKAMFAFRTGCESCGIPSQFVADSGLVMGKTVIMIAQCGSCGEFSVFKFKYEDFVALFCGGEK